MAEIKNYPIEFIERTIIMLDKLEASAKENNLEVTFFINSLFGLIVLSVENIDKYKNSCFSIKLNNEKVKGLIPKKVKSLDFKKLLDDNRKIINKFDFIEDLSKNSIELTSFSFSFINHTELMNNNLMWLMRKIRNGIAHQHIKPINESEQWEGIRIWNKNDKGIKDFEIEFKINELKDFSIFIAKLYLSNLK